MNASAVVLGASLLSLAAAAVADGGAAAEPRGEAFTRELVAREVGEVAAIRSLPPRPNSGPERSASDFGFSSAASAEQNAVTLDRVTGSRATTARSAASR